jgi:signal transduction histidine kinase
VKSSDNLNKQGIGLGLTICKSICEKLDGWINVDSIEGKGSEFQFGIKI